MDTSQHGSEEFDTEGAMFQKKESLDKKEKKTRNTADSQHAGSSDFYTEFVMRDAFGRQVENTDHMKCTET